MKFKNKSEELLSCLIGHLKVLRRTRETSEVCIETSFLSHMVTLVDESWIFKRLSPLFCESILSILLNYPAAGLESLLSLHDVSIESIKERKECDYVYFSFIQFGVKVMQSTMEDSHFIIPFKTLSLNSDSSSSHSDPTDAYELFSITSCIYSIVSFLADVTAHPKIGRYTGFDHIHSCYIFIFSNFTTFISLWSHISIFVVLLQSWSNFFIESPTIQLFLLTCTLPLFTSFLPSLRSLRSISIPLNLFYPPTQPGSSPSGI